MGLSVTNLACARGGVSVLEGLSFDVPDGTALILRGANGIGKTTLLRTIAGLQSAVSGQIAPDTESIVYSGHLDAVKATLSVEENLAFWADVYGTAKIEEALTSFDLHAFRDRMGGKLSAGQTRRLGLARLVVSDRPVWILDEPTVSLDGFAKRDLMGVLQSHLQGGGSILLTSHVDLDLEAPELDLSPFRAHGQLPDGFDEAFE